MDELLAVNISIGYWVVKVPVVDGLIWFPLMLVPSQPLVASVGRLAMVPPGSEHSMIWSPVGRMPVKPVPETVIIWPSLKGPVGIVTVSPWA